ncbi:family 20 glycosylhydrolase [Mucilaginibacter segetis]|uniref:beta-N-acetylhexosaminidase n=1 Tax=Mucilaginibacter segetis TaxID=2793071 RepID=A0A934PQN4_9SPHI|nr:family 20 glycosylhydrolase [Mucilaginibacter segetis]MBK0377670.1 carbohydate-binding domain-containing protein [Mucilaginibacter segetis]
MRRILIPLVVVALCISSFVNIADKPDFDVHNLQISWEVVDNNYQNKQQSLTAVVITNTGKTAFPANGWKFYFNSSRGFTANAATGNALIEQINGDLFSITPNADFKMIKPGESERIEMVCEAPVVNFTDAIEGIYLVWNSEPDKGYLPGDFTIKPYKPEYKGLVTPQIIYDQNKTITDIAAGELPNVFPSPLNYSATGGTFKLTANVHVTATDDRFSKEAASLTHDLTTLMAKPKGSSTGIITLNYQAGMDDEAYELSVKPAAITITASTPAGIFYGIQSLKTMIPASAWQNKQATVEISCAEVKDEPRFEHRAVMLDVARNFRTKQEVMKLIDAMALYKLNVLHMHLTDDEGWRLQIPSLPELTDVGAKRGHTLDSKHFLPPSHGSGPDFSNTSGTGFYTVADYTEILKHATERHIRVIPEVETPGHARASIKAMDARYDRLIAAGDKAGAEKYLLNDLNDESQYRSVQYWNDNVIDVALPSTYNFVSTVVDDIITIYKNAGAPLTTIHFGGDEVPAHVWEKSPAYLTLKASHPEIKNTNDLWYYFYGRVNDILNQRHLLLSGWEEMALRKTMVDGQPTYIPNPDFTSKHLQVDVWNNVLGDGQEDLAYKLANAGYKVTLTNVTNLYFDMANYKSFDEPGYYWGAFLGIDKFFSFIPFDYFKNADVDKNGNPINRAIFVGKQRLTDYGKQNIVGIQGALWSETIKSDDRMEYMIFPKLLALAERAWAKDPTWTTEKDTQKAQVLYQQDWNSFLNILGKRELPRLSYLDGGYNYRIPKPGVVLQDGKYVSNIQFPGMVIRYTTNGKEPDAKSKLYTGPVDASGVVKFRAFDVKGRGGNTAVME